MALTLFSALEAFRLAKQAAGKSRFTIRNYRATIKKIRLFTEGQDPDLADADRAFWVDFFVWLQDEYVGSPGGAAAREPKPLSQKSLCNIHTDLSAFYTWLTSPGIELVEAHLIRTIERPQYDLPQIETFTRDQIAALLRACDRSAQWENRPDTRNARPTRTRDRTIIHVLLSTGIRASELCNMRFADINTTDQTILVAGKGRGRGSKERLVPFGKTCAKALWTYLTPRLSRIHESDHVFTVGPDDLPRSMSRDVLCRLIARIGDRAEVPHCYPHRFRHTFATEYLRNGGDVIRLRAILGHTTMDMVQRYVHFIAVDLRDAHRSADPADKWRLPA